MARDVTNIAASVRAPLQNRHDEPFLCTPGHETGRRTASMIGVRCSGFRIDMFFHEPRRKPGTATKWRRGVAATGNAGSWRANRLRSANSHSFR